MSKYAALALTAITGLVVALLTGQVPASADVTDATLEPGQTEFSARTPKVATGVCPPGKRVTGGFGRVTGLPQHVVLTGFQPIHTSSGDRFEVTAAADETGLARQWAVTAVAVCADPLPEQQIADFTVSAQPGSTGRTAFVNCPGDLRMVGSGGRINGGQGQVHLGRTGPVTESSPFRASAQGQADGTGFAGGWSVTAYAVCARVADADVARVSADSELNSSPLKDVDANCPPGMFVTGGGADVVNATGDTVIQDIMPEALPGGIPGDSVTVVARENQPDARSWLARAWAHCAA